MKNKGNEEKFQEKVGLIYLKISKLLAIIGSIVNLYISIRYYLKEGYTFYLIVLITSISVLVYFILDFTKKIKIRK